MENVMRSRKDVKENPVKNMTSVHGNFINPKKGNSLPWLDMKCKEEFM